MPKDIYEQAWSPAAWEEYYNKVLDSGHLTKREERYLRKFIDEKQYLPILENLAAGLPFPHPERILLNKKGTDRKRAVFAFPQAENELLRFFGHALHRYDSLFAKNLYSFISGKSAKDALRYLVKRPRIRAMYALKLDIHDYFNSVDVALLLPMLQEVLKGEDRLYDFMAAILRDPYAITQSGPEAMQKGIIAGSPLSPFLADLYLAALDEHFWALKIPYARYADDIILFAPTAEELNGHFEFIKSFLAERGLTLNPRKIKHSAPGEGWEFLGFFYHNGTIDISAVALQKIKAKVRRKARAIYRWRRKKGATGDQAVRVFIRYFKRKFYDNPTKNELTWCRWYFPVINTTDSLHKIDSYMQESMRYIATGSHKKAAYNYRYAAMKENGYRPLRHEYYAFLRKP